MCWVSVEKKKKTWQNHPFFFEITADVHVWSLSLVCGEKKYFYSTPINRHHLLVPCRHHRRCRVACFVFEEGAQRFSQRVWRCCLGPTLGPWPTMTDSSHPAWQRYTAHFHLQDLVKLREQKTYPGFNPPLHTQTHTDWQPFRASRQSWVGAWHKVIFYTQPIVSAGLARKRREKEILSFGLSVCLCMLVCHNYCKDGWAI